jgi:hypothetical protein
MRLRDLMFLCTAVRARHLPVMWTLLPLPCFCKLLLFSTRFPDAKTINTTVTDHIWTTVVNCSPSLFAGSFVRVWAPQTVHITNFLRKVSALTYTRVTSQLSGVLPWPHTANISRSLESLFFVYVCVCIFGVRTPPKRKTSLVSNVRDAVKRQRMVPN